METRKELIAALRTAYRVLNASNTQQAADLDPRDHLLCEHLDSVILGLHAHGTLSHDDLDAFYATL